MKKLLLIIIPFSISTSALCQSLTYYVHGSGDANKYSRLVINYLGGGDCSVSFGPSGFCHSGFAHYLYPGDIKTDVGINYKLEKYEATENSPHYFIPKDTIVKNKKGFEVFEKKHELKYNDDGYAKIILNFENDTLKRIVVNILSSTQDVYNETVSAFIYEMTHRYKEPVKTYKSYNDYKVTEWITEYMGRKIGIRFLILYEHAIDFDLAAEFFLIED